MTLQEREADFDVEQRLREDTGGQYRAQLQARLGDMLGACHQARRQFHDRDSYRRLEAAMFAVKAASTVLELTPHGPAGR